MKLTLAVAGRLRAGPEKDLGDDYIARAAKLGHGLGFAPLELREFTLRGMATRAEMTAMVMDALAPGTMRLVLDERGQDMSSKDFAQMLARLRDDGASHAAVLVGGADGWAAPMRQGAAAVLRFGRWTWPHRLVRAMAAEQIYRALSILAGAPYHREN